jgi:RES domain-containing protein
MEVYHLGKSKFARQLTGEGAKLHGGRWNLIGEACLYASASKALSVLEYAANVSLEEMPYSLSVTVYQLPAKCWKQFGIESLPENWDLIPAPEETKRWGSQYLQQAKILALKLPSVIIPSEFNFILNPLHPDFKKVKIKEVQAFTFDRRIKNK